MNKVATATYRTTIIDGQFEKLTFIAQNKFISLNIFKSFEPGGFTWTMDNNFTAYETTIVELPVDRVDIASGLNFAIEGQPYGVIRGSFAAKDDNGNLLINPSTGKIRPVFIDIDALIAA